MNSISYIESQTKLLRNKINNHSLYKNLSSIEDVKTFMENHVFAVWDFMSLLKALQSILTNNNVPWTPKGNGTTARFINEIVMGEESDINENGEAKSHFEMYIDAMEQINANTNQIRKFISLLENKSTLRDSINTVNLDPILKNFINFTFDVIKSEKAHCIASAFTFGREDVIPDMFLKIIQKSKTDSTDQRYSKLLYYLNRHIEIDGDEHGPISLKMVENLCGDDTKKWDEALDIAKLALKQRIKLWDLINRNINCNNDILITN
jgi:hypothetical protein